MTGGVIQRLQDALNTWATHPAFDGQWLDATLTRPGLRTQDAGTGTITEGPATDYPVRAKRDDFTETERQGDIVRVSDIVLDLPPATLTQLTPALTDIVTLGGITYAIVRRLPGQMIRLHLRRGA